jgi:hypothetical protein
MFAVIQKYRVILIILFFLVLAVFLSWFVLKPDVDKIPSRGIFVSV